MDLFESEKSFLRQLHDNAEMRVALKKLIINALVETDVQVKQLDAVWKHIELQVAEDKEDKEEGNDSAV